MNSVISRIPLRSGACLALLIFFVGVAACLVCDLNQCSEDACHESDHECRCVCALAGLPGTVHASLSQDEPPSFSVALPTCATLSFQPSALFRPPRA